MIIAARRRYKHAAGQATGLPLSYVFSFDLFTLFIYTTRAAYATLAMYIGRSLRGAKDPYGSSARPLAVPVLHTPLTTVPFRHLPKSGLSTPSLRGLVSAKFTETECSITPSPLPLSKLPSAPPVRTP